jgi:hypothetical protein
MMRSRSANFGGVGISASLAKSGMQHPLLKTGKQGTLCQHRSKEGHFWEDA